MLFNTVAACLDNDMITYTNDTRLCILWQIAEVWPLYSVVYIFTTGL